MTIRQQILGQVGVAPPDSSWLVRLIWALIDVDYPALEEFDIEVADAIGNVPDAPWTADGHTISYHLGDLEAHGDTAATDVCDVIAQFMGPNHCINAYDNGNGT